MNRNIFRIVLLLLGLYHISTSAFAATQFIKIHTQEEFDEIGSKIRNAIAMKDVDAVIVDVVKGSYFFHDAHLNLSALNYPEKSIIINGTSSIIIADNTTNVKEGLEPYHVCYLDCHLNALQIWSDVVQLTSNIEVLDADTKCCRALIPSGVIIDSNSQYIKITEWFKVGIYKIIQIKDGYVYFIADDLSSSNYGYSVNWDEGYGHKSPRMQVLMHSPSEAQYICKAGQFLIMGGTQLKHLEFNNLCFNGSSASHILFMFSNIQADNISIKNCRFQNCLGILSYLVKTSNFSFINNHVENCDNICVKSEGGCHNTQVLENSFMNVCAYLNNKAAIMCSGANFLIKNNRFTNFSYTSVACGQHYSTKNPEPASGIIDNNEFSHNNKFRSSIAKYGLMDGGAIYVATQTDGITIRNNYIHDISGIKDNRGIFCDDGTKNVTITANLIQHIQNSYCIDLRNVTYVAEKIPDHNTGNTCTENLVDGDIRFYLRDESCKEFNNKKIGERGYKSMKAYKNWKRKIR